MALWRFSLGHLMVESGRLQTGQLDPISSAVVVAAAGGVAAATALLRPPWGTFFFKKNRNLCVNLSWLRHQINLATINPLPFNLI